MKIKHYIFGRSKKDSDDPVDRCKNIFKKYEPDLSFTRIAMSASEKILKEGTNNNKILVVIPIKQGGKYSVSRQNETNNVWTLAFMEGPGLSHGKPIYGFKGSQDSKEGMTPPSNTTHMVMYLSYNSGNDIQDVLDAKIQVEQNDTITSYSDCAP